MLLKTNSTKYATKDIRKIMQTKQTPCRAHRTLENFFWFCVFFVNTKKYSHFNLEINLTIVILAEVAVSR